MSVSELEPIVAYLLIGLNAVRLRQRVYEPLRHPRVFPSVGLQHTITMVLIHNISTSNYETNRNKTSKQIISALISLFSKSLMKRKNRCLFVSAMFFCSLVSLTKSTFT